MSERFASWGRVPQVKHAAIRRVHWRSQPIPVGEGESILPRGLGRSYGDSCLNDGQVLLDTRALDHLISFDSNSGVLHCEAGVTLKEILQFAVPRGWFLPVTPGTKYVTVGGAIANDVHGKNHHHVGAFGNHVLGFSLRRSTGETVYCTPEHQPELFSATIGGLGLTGLILSAELQLRRIRSAYLDVEKLAIHGLEDFLGLSESSESAFDYTVAWVDCTASGASLGRGVFMRANHAEENTRAAPYRKPGDPLTIPVDAPQFILNRWSVRLFNRLYYYLQTRRHGSTLEHYEPFFYPLDSIGNWNRLYGKRGLYQYQCVIPKGHQEAVRDLLSAISASGGGSFLSVLKVFGDVPSRGMLSFARPGVTLALDFANEGEKSEALFRRLDQIVHAAGGALYPAKDARMPGEMFRQSFPRWEEFARHMDPAFSSSFWRRVAS